MAPPADDAWDQPVLFGDVDVPPFPLDTLPPWLAQWSSELAVAIQVPPDLPALLGLAAASLALAKKCAVLVKPGWVEPINIYAAVALAPGEGKSPVFTAAMSPLRNWETEARDRLAPQIAEREESTKLREETLKELRRSASKASDDRKRSTIEKRLFAMVAEDATAPKPVVPPRLFADDATPEAVGRLLSEQHGRLGIFSSEGGPLAILAGRYSDGRANFELFLKAHSGDSFNLDRIGRDSIHLESPILTIALTVQPAVISGLASTPQFRALGLLARFLFAIPRTLVGSRDPNPPALSDEARLEYDRRLRGLLDLHGQHNARGEIVPTQVPLSEEAYARLVQFKTEIEPRLGEGGDLHHIADWGNKLGGLVARLAGVLRVAEIDGARIPDSIPLETLARAVTIGEYALAHARAAFGLIGGNPATDLAKHIWVWAIRMGTSSVTKRDIHRAMQSRAPRVDDLNPALNVLIERSLLRERQELTVRAKGRPASAIYDVNPLARQ